MTGLIASPWPAEDGGPDRRQHVGPGLAPGADERLTAVVRSTMMSTMTVLGAPGEVFLLRHSALRANLRLPTTSRVERIDPETLRPLLISPPLPGGPMWPGGMAVHANGDIYVTYGRWTHRLGRDCRLKASLKLPIAAPYNSFVTLACGLLVTKNLSDSASARLSVIDPETMAEVGFLDCGEPSIARLSATEDTVYVVGTKSIFRAHWQRNALVIDPDWRWCYPGSSGNSYGWDVVLAAGSAWFMDNGRHRYRTSMIGAGLTKTANRLLRVGLADSCDNQAVTISGLAGGSVTNPPLVDERRSIVVGYDSANRHLAAFSLDLKPIWQRDDIGCASHMLLFADTGEIVTNDYRRGCEWVVVLDIATGSERGRVRIGGLMQGVVFPSPGWKRDLYWCSMTKVARVFVTPSL